jgi:hypothetical protein
MEGLLRVPENVRESDGVTAVFKFQLQKKKCRKGSGGRRRRRVEEEWNTGTNRG